MSTVTIRFFNGTDPSMYNVYIYESTTPNLPTNLNASSVTQAESGSNNVHLTLSNLGYLWVFLYPKDITKANSAILFNVNNAVSQYYKSGGYFAFNICDSEQSTGGVRCAGFGSNWDYHLGIKSPNSLYFTFPSTNRSTDNPIIYNSSQNLLNQVDFWYDSGDGLGLQKITINSDVVPIIPSSNVPTSSNIPTSPTVPSPSSAPGTTSTSSNNWIWWVLGIVVFILIILVIVAVIIILKKKHKKITV